MTLYRKYRPQHFSELVGQNAVQTTLQQALHQGRIAHAYLFSGSRGTGKTSTARIFARAITCLKPKIKEGKEGTPPQYEPCDQCEACLLILNNHTPDLLEIDAASNRGIEDIRELREQTHYPPLQLKKKVYIIDEVHMLTGEAFNALLKTLEEPPDHCLFILATTESHKVPITIRSRCQIIRFERGSVDSIQQKLDSVVSQENFKVESGVTRLLAEHAEGGFRDAETFLDNLTTQHPELTLERAQTSLGILQQENIDQLLTASLLAQAQEVTRLLKKFFGSDTSQQPLDRVLVQLIKRVRQIIFIQETNNSTQQEFLLQMVKQTNQKILAYALEQFLEAYLLYKGSPLPSLPLEIACLNISTFTLAPTQVTTRQVLAETPAPTEQAASSAITPQIIQEVSAPQPPPVKESHPATLSQSPTTFIAPVSTPATSVPVVELREEVVKDVRKAWKLMVDKICDINVAIGQALKQATVHTIQEQTIIVYVRYVFHADKLREKKNYAQMKQILFELTDAEWDINFVVTNTAPRNKPTQKLGSGLDDALAVFGTKSEGISE